ncbi:MAG: polyprenyl synthetase family protein [Rhodospirillales bacterium]|nr:polyprenyl synthetase family protein [Rhodospirillales bacterium]USO08547.1 MAG: polyprenyl synthetase family protein [Rhodospirillales bacterium]
MTALKHKDCPASNPAASPLDRLAALLEGEMDATNAAILARARSHIPLIPQVAEYLIAAGGKRIRPLLTLAAANLFGGAPGAPGLAAAVEFIHTATLFHDDVIDESAQRRGKPAANLVFGNKAAVLVGDFLFGRAFEMMVETDDLRILAILSRAARVMSEGEVLQMSLTGDIDITIDQYRDIIDAKTAALFSGAAESGALLAGCDDTGAAAMRDYGYHLGMAFQMIDDLMDYTGRTAKMGKESGDDFREGKMTLPVILAIGSADDEERAFWTRTMQAHDQTPADLETARALIAQHDAVSRGRDIARDHAARARAALAPCPQCELRGVLEDVLDFVVARDH